MPRNPLLLAACSLVAWLCLAAGPIHADSAFAESAEPKRMKPDSNGIALQTPEQGDLFPRPEYKSYRAAYAWSILGTTAPVLLASQVSGSYQETSKRMAVGVMLGGLLAGPSMGQFYAGSPVGGFLGFGIRGAGGFITGLGYIFRLGEDLCSGTEEFEEEDEDCDEDNVGRALLAVGALTYIGGTLFSLVDAGKAVERHNDRQNQPRVFGWSPTLAPGAQGNLRSGATAWMRF